MAELKTIFKGDAACNLVTLTNPDNVPLSRVDVQVGVVCKSYTDPTFPLYVDLEEEETELLNVGANKIYVAVHNDCGKHTSQDIQVILVQEKAVMCPLTPTPAP